MKMERLAFGWEVSVLMSEVRISKDGKRSQCQVNSLEFGDFRKADDVRREGQRGRGIHCSHFQTARHFLMRIPLFNQQIFTEHPIIRQLLCFQGIPRCSASFRMFTVQCGRPAPDSREVYRSGACSPCRPRLG